MKQLISTHTKVNARLLAAIMFLQYSFLFGLFVLSGHTAAAQTCNPDDPTAAGGTSFCAPTPVCASGNFIWSQAIDPQTGSISPSVIRLIASSTEYYKIPPSTFPTAFSGPVTITVTDVVSYDGYINRENTTAQPHERWYIRFDKGTTIVGQTPLTGDVADGVNQAYWRGPLGTTMFFPNGFDEIVLIHESFPNQQQDGQSVVPASVCINYSTGNGAIGNFVWNDYNGNGVQDAGEPGIPGVTVKLLGSDCNTVITTTTTDASGLYLFSGLPAGTYSVEFVTPAGFNVSPSNVPGDDTKDSDPVNGKVCGIVLDPDETDLTIDAGFFAPGALGDRVWNDLDGNGIQGTGEPGIQGVTVRLLASDCTTELATTTTDATGYYLFGNLPAGTYGVQFETPAGMIASPDNEGPDDLDSDPENGKVCNIVLPPGGSNGTIDAGFFAPGSIGDRVWDDYNNNGIQDNGEPGIPGVTVRLLDTECGSILAYTTTDASGYYLFSGLASGTYGVQFVTPAGATASPDNAGNDDAVDSDPVNGKVCNIALAPGENDLSIDAGFFTPASIGDRVWNDYNNNGIQDNGEPGISGVTVNLLGADCTTLLTSTTTDASGYYLFEGLITGNYSVEFVTPAGTNVSPANVGGDDAIDSDPVNGKVCNFELAPAENNLTIDAGFFTPGSLGDRVWNDINGNGIQDNGEPGISGVTVNLLEPDCTTVVATTTTNASGNYLFEGLIPGTYGVEFVTPAGMIATPGNQGNDDAIDSDPVNGKVCNIVLAPGENNLSIDAGFFTPGSIGDRVWNDANGNGIQDPNESGIPGVTVKLLGPDCTTVLATTTTNASGNYLFSGLPAGTYGVQFVTPAGATASPANEGGDDAIDSDPVNGKVCNIELAPGENNLTSDAGFILSTTICYKSCVNNPAVGATQTVTNNGNGTTTIRTTFAKTFVDNCYMPSGNADNWNRRHRFSDLVSSDELKLQLFNGNGAVTMDVTIDYISASSAAPSGYKSLGVTSISVGNISDVVSATTSLDVNLNNNGPAYYGLTSTSPATNSSYTPNPTYPNFIYDVWYEVTVMNSAFGASGFGYPRITEVHASPSKTGNSTECVEPCPVFTVTAVGSNGPCATTCQGSINVTPANGVAPYTYSWVDNGTPSNVTTQNRTGLCAGTYVVTVTDANNQTASATVVISNPPANCPPPICYQSCTNNPAVSATQTVNDNGNGTTTIRTTFAKTFVDNCYAPSGNADNWNRSHTFSDLVGSDQLKLQLYNGNGAVSMDVTIDYISASSAAPSGYQSLGVTNISVGNASDVVSATTSLDVNLNNNGPAYYGLTSTSPATNSSYTPNPTYPNFIYDVWYEVTVKNSAFGASGFGYPRITEVHASPSKTGNNSECVEPCPVFTVTAVGSNGPCATTCQGSINVTPANGVAPYTYSWVDNGTPSNVTTQNRTGLCAGTYVVTVTDANNQTASATVVISNPPANCPPACTYAGVNLGNLTNYFMVFTDGRGKANWQSSSKGYIGDVAIDGLQAKESSSGSFAYAGTIYSNASTLDNWQRIVDNNPGQAFGSTNKVAMLAGLESDLENVFSQVNALPVTPGYNNRSSTSLNGLNTQNGTAETFVINITSGFGISSKINITGDAGDIFILRWDTDANFSDGYEGQVKFQSGGAIVPLGGLKPTNFLHVAGDINASGGGSNPALPYPQGPRTNDGTGTLINGASNFSGGGFFTGYWFTTGAPTITGSGQRYGKTASLSNAIFVGGWYSKTTEFSMTSGTSGVYVSPVCVPNPPAPPFARTAGDNQFGNDNDESASTSTGNLRQTDAQQQVTTVEQQQLADVEPQVTTVKQQVTTVEKQQTVVVNSELPKAEELWLPKEKNDRFNVHVYPNPSASDFTILVNSKSTEPVFVRIMDMNGVVRIVHRVIAKANYIKVGKNLNAGIYMAEIVQGKNRQLVKLIKLN